MSKRPEDEQNGQAKVYDPGKSHTKEAGMKLPGHDVQPSVESNNKMGMREMAARDTRYHLQPMPEASPAEVDPFPVMTLQMLAIGCLVGLLIGIGWAAIMLHGLVVIGGWEGLFSMTPFTFYVFWAFIGLALGGFLIGVGAVLVCPKRI